MMFSHLLLPSLIHGADLLGMIALIGGLVFTAVITPTGRARSFRLVLPVSSFLLLIGIADLVLRSQMISGRPVAELWRFTPRVLLNSHFGKVWIARTLLLCFLGTISILGFTAKTKQAIALIIGVTLLLTVSLSGHAADSGNISLAVVTDWLHLLAASVWVGGLFFLAVELKRGLAFYKKDHGSSAQMLVASIQRFSRMAAYSVMVLLISGGFQAWLQVGSFRALFETSYGKTLMVKLLLALPLFGFGALNRYSVLPRLVRHRLTQSVTSTARSLRHLFRSVVVEAGLAFVIVAVAALLTQLPPAKNQLASAYAHGAATHFSHGQAHPSPPASAEGARVKILLPKQGQVFTTDEIPLQVEFIKGKRGHHLHAYVDGELIGMFETEKGILNGIRPGRHVLEVRVVAEDHVTELNATDLVAFVRK